MKKISTIIDRIEEEARLLDSEVKRIVIGVDSAKAELENGVILILK